MKKILLGFIAIGLLMFVGCDKDDDTEAIDGTETSSDDGSTDSDSGDGATDDSSVEYGEGATDIDGNLYKSVIIGTQEWMAENLRTTKYSDGTAIPNITDNDEWSDLETGAWCNYGNDSQYDTIYGKLYNWYAVETGKLCPTGWHVPTGEEWTLLTGYLAANGHDGKDGAALKATSDWDYDGNGTDDYGWLGLPGSTRSEYGLFGVVGYEGFWWSSSESETYHAWSRGFNSGDYVFDLTHYKNYGSSVRCLRD